jgi:hypothetical protein
MTTYEKNPHLHAHHLVHVPPDLTGRIMSWDQGNDGDIHVGRADRFSTVYITKQRKWMGPEIEGKIADRHDRRLWAKSSYIAGPRLTFTRDAKALIASHTSARGASNVVSDQSA